MFVTQCKGTNVLAVKAYFHFKQDRNVKTRGGSWIFYVGEAVVFLITTGCCFHFVALFRCRKV